MEREKPSHSIYTTLFEHCTVQRMHVVAESAFSRCFEVTVLTWERFLPSVNHDMPRQSPPVIEHAATENAFILAIICALCSVRLIVQVHVGRATKAGTRFWLSFPTTGSLHHVNQGWYRVLQTEKTQLQCGHRIFFFYSFAFYFFLLFLWGKFYSKFCSLFFLYLLILGDVSQPFPKK